MKALILLVFLTGCAEVEVNRLRCPSEFHCLHEISRIKDIDGCDSMDNCTVVLYDGTRLLVEHPDSLTSKLADTLKDEDKND